MEQRYYKIRLENGRVVGPVDLDRIKLFIANERVVGKESARLYPSGEWRDINTFPEIAEILLAKITGKLKIDLPKSAIEQELKEIEEKPEPAEDVPLQEAAALEVKATPATVNEDDEKTIIRSVHEEKTTVRAYDPPAPKIETEKEHEREATFMINRGIAQEKTAMFTRPTSGGGAANAPALKKKRLIFIAVAVVAALAILLSPDKKPTPKAIKFEVRLPDFGQQDPINSDKIYKQAIEAYVSDTVDGYKKAAALFWKSASTDVSNARALCMLASSYLNLLDVIQRDENYFGTITKLIEMARAKGVDLPETVIADAELYLALGNADAAFSRIVDYSKNHQYGPEMYMILAAAYLSKSDGETALKTLAQINPKAWFSTKIPYLYGRAFELSGNRAEAIKAYNEAVRRSPTHIHARVRLIELSFLGDNMSEALKNAEYVLENQSLASPAEQARAHYFRARLRMLSGKDEEAKVDLEAALKKAPEEADYLLEYYTLRSKMGAKVGDASGKAKMFEAMAVGEKALKSGDLASAHKAFLTARQAQESDPSPLMRLSEVYRRKGDLQSAKQNLDKAVKLAPSKAELYPNYIKALIETWEFEEAKKAIEVYKGLGARPAILDRLNGDLYFKQQRLREAMSYTKRAVGDPSADSDDYTAYADILFAGGAFRDSAFYYGLALRFDPYNVKATIGSAKSIAELDGVARGVDYLNEALKRSPRKAELTNGLAEIFFRKGDYQAALKTVDQAIAYDNEMAAAYKTKGDVLAAMDKTKDALDAYLSYAGFAPGDPEGHIDRYKLFLKKIDLKSARESIQKVIDSYPRYPGAYTMLGDLYREASNFSSALEAAKQELAYNPSWLPAYVLAAQALNAAKEYNSALEYMNKALKIDPAFVPALIQAGDTNRNMKSYGAAAALLQRALSLDPGNPQIHKRLGLLYLEMGDHPKAVQHIRAYIDLFPDAPDRQEMERVIGR